MDKSSIHLENNPYNSAKINSRFLLLVGFLVGMSIMGIEMATSRLLTPYLGNSLYIWTNIIGIIMLSMTIGYSWGGKIADRYASERLLYLIILIAALYITIIPWLTKLMLTIMLQWITENPLSMFYVSLVASLPLFVIPFACLGMVTPYIIKLSSQQISTVGRVAGKVAAYSTVGSIIGTFVPVFLLIPFLGTQKTIWLLAAILMFISMVGLLKVSFYQPNVTTDHSNADLLDNLA